MHQDFSLDLNTFIVPAEVWLAFPANNCFCALIEPCEAWLIVEAAAVSLLGATDYA
jgi:hypothetical protein